MTIPAAFTYTRRHPDTVAPVRATVEAAGLDLTADHDVTIPAGGSAWVCTGIAVALQPATVGKLYVRSSLGTKRDIVLANGTGIIDSDYRGWIKAKLRNNSRKRVEITRGERIVQLVVQPVVTDNPVEADELPATERGAGGFGSTGTGEITPGKEKKSQMRQLADDVYRNYGCESGHVHWARRHMEADRMRAQLEVIRDEFRKLESVCLQRAKDAGNNKDLMDHATNVANMHESTHKALTLILDWKEEK